jgi:endonuclease YncB( thermonuclease family)
MPNRLITSTLALIAATLFGMAVAADSKSVLTGAVSRVVDGDTIDVQLSSGPIRVRLYGIDAPESTQPGGGDATAYLVKRILHQTVELEPFRQDRYDRLIAIVYLGDENMNEKLVLEGHAWAFRRYLKHADAIYCKDEAQARSARRGLWSPQGERPIAPWEYRKRKSLGAFTDYSPETADRCIAGIGLH